MLFPLSNSIIHKDETNPPVALNSSDEWPNMRYLIVLVVFKVFIAIGATSKSKLTPSPILTILFSSSSISVIKSLFLKRNLDVLIFVWIISNFCRFSDKTL